MLGIAALAFLSVPASAVLSKSYSATVTTDYTLVANFNGELYKYDNIAIMNPTAVAIDCAEASDASAPTLRIPVGFTSITMDRYRPTGALYCKVGSSTAPVIVNIWGL